MNTITISKNELANLVRQNVREAVSAEFLTWRAAVLPMVSKAEQKDIEKRFGRPAREPARTIFFDKN